MKSVLVVCEGNICRSPMAQGLLACALPQLRVASAGLNALIGKPADESAVLLMRQRGIDIRTHRAVQITRPMCLEFDIVLVMDREQRRRLQQLYPEIRGRVFRLGEHGNMEVPDPYRQSLEAFRTALSIIDDSVDLWLDRIQRL